MATAGTVISVLRAVGSLTVVLLVLATCLVSSVFAAEPAVEDAQLQQIVQSVLEDDQYQLQLPDEEIDEEEVPSWLRWLMSLNLPTFGLGQIVLILLALAAVVLLVLGVLASLRRRSWEQAASQDTGSTFSPAGPLPFRPVTLGEAEAAAARGHYGEAVHLLLLHALGLLKRQQPRAVSKARTSREVLGRVRLPQLAQEALETLVGKTESWLFGGRELGEPDYRGCLEACRTLRQSSSAGNVGT